MSASVALGKQTADVSYTQCIVIDIELCVANGPRPVRALLDTGAQANFLSQTLAIEEGLRGNQASTMAQAVDGHAVTVYGQHCVAVRVRDSMEESREHQVDFIATDMKYYDVILGWPWISNVNPVCDFHKRTWVYRKEAMVASVEVGKIIEAENAGEDVYLAVFRPVARETHVVQANTLQVDARPRDGQGGTTELSSLPDRYRDYEDVFSEEEASKFPESTTVEHSIDIEEGKKVPFGPIYRLSEKELSVLRNYLDSAMAKGWIQPSQSPAGAPILFVPKKDGSLRLCVDYRGVNKVTVKNRHPLPLISEILDRLSRAVIFSKFDLRDAYHRIRIKKSDRWKTAFRSRYGHFEYLVMPFGLTNAPATFQAYVHQALERYVDVICIVYLDDIIVFSEKEEDHERDVKLVLEALRKASLYIKLAKCVFHTKVVDFVGYWVSTIGISMDTSRVQAINEWPTPASFRDIQVFLGFANFYRKFINGYSMVVTPMTDLLKGMERGKKTGPFSWPDSAQHAFEKLKACFNRAPVLQHFDNRKQSKLETDASGFAIAGVLSQPCEHHHNETIDWRPVAFYSRKLNVAEMNYTTGDQEMLAIVEAFKEWRHYLESPILPTMVMSDHHNLQQFMTTKSLSGRQARWAEVLARYDFSIVHIGGKTNPADGPSRRPDYAREAAREDRGNPLADLLSKRLAGKGKNSHEGHMSVTGTFAVRTRALANRTMHTPIASPTADGPGATSEGHVGTTEATDCSELSPYGKIPSALTSHLLSLQHRDAFCKERSWEMTSEIEIPNGPFMGRWHRGHDGVVRRAGAVYVPDDKPTRIEILRINHDDPWQGGHFGKKRTLGAVARSYWWPKLRNHVEDYVRSCDICQRVKAPRHKPYGLLAPLPQPEQPWQDIAMDFITCLPPAMRRKKAYDAVLVVVDRFSRMVRYIACSKAIDAPELGDRLIEEIFSKMGAPRSIVSDRGSAFTSNYWGTLCYYLVVRRRFSTAFHPQTDGQTERMNQTLECYLRCYVNYQQDDWVMWLPCAEYAYNQSIHAETGKTPFELVLTYKPDLSVGQPGTVREGENQLAKEKAEELDDATAQGKEIWSRSREAMAKHYNKKHIEKTYRVGDQVMLAARHIQTKRPCKKLDDKFLGPFRIAQMVGQNAYRLMLPQSYGRLHATFHVSLLEPYRNRKGRKVPKPVPVHGEEEWEIDDILDSRSHHGRTMYLVRWKGFTKESDSWEPQENLENAKAMVDAYEKRRKT